MSLFFFVAAEGEFWFLAVLVKKFSPVFCSKGRVGLVCLWDVNTSSLGSLAAADRRERERERERDIDRQRQRQREESCNYNRS